MHCFLKLGNYPIQTLRSTHIKARFLLSLEGTALQSVRSAPSIVRHKVNSFSMIEWSEKKF
jgi:hypothetical protein